ncbi:hypothetical protein [Lysobacter panacisoli]|uniref:hypothetical protein n=1 Tax=Lysobacter panacisoli TaxID=1255263 RepID=UPI00131B0E02|nr:hypothetical protein [Lysobacter panacisoli]
MPAHLPHRQHETVSGPLAWFGSEAGQGLLAVQETAMARVLASQPAAPWVWLGTHGAAPPDIPGGRGVLLHRNVAGFDGAVRCALPLPFASEAMGAVLVQHALDDGFAIDDVLDECGRILMPGGTLWLAALNPWSPYRARWARSGLHARDPGGWQSSLRRTGFAVDTVSLQWFGPHWRVAHGDVGVGAADRLRAGIALTVNKRVHALIPPKPLRNLRWQAGSTRSHLARRGTAIMKP